MNRRTAALPLALAGLCACLDAADEEIPLSQLAGPAGTQATDVPIIAAAGLPNYDPTLATTSLTPLQGFAAGEGVIYWNVDGAISRIIAPFYEVLDVDGERAHSLVIDVVPGDPGYTPFWRKVVVRATERYNGEVLWSRDAIDAAIAAGIVEDLEPTDLVYNCPVVTSTTVTVPQPGPGQTRPRLGRVFYRGVGVPWVDLGDPIVVPTSQREMPIEPVYLMQRIDEPGLIYEFVTRVDIDGDAELTQSNNIFAEGLDDDRYTPLWQATLLRVTSDYVSVETGTAAAELKGEAEFLDARGNVISDRIVGTPMPLEDGLVNCPIRPADPRGGN